MGKEEVSVMGIWKEQATGYCDPLDKVGIRQGSPGREGGDKDGLREGGTRMVSEFGQVCLD